MCRLTVAVIFATLIGICLLGAGLSKQCRKLDPAISKLCGYDYTVEFQHESHFNSSLRALHFISKNMGNCSEYSSLIACSLYLPRCEEDIAGPYLPCKGVCDEYVKSCGETIITTGLEWSVGMCQLLPESDDPQTNKGYMGRCFEPLNFKETAGDATFKCSKLVEPLCKDLGYDETVVSEVNQRVYATGLKDFIGNYTADKKCGEMRRQFVCTEFFMACRNNKPKFLCRSKCQKFFDTCEAPFHYGKDLCIEFPDGNSSSGLCHQTHWPKYGNWPEPPTTLPPTTTGPPATLTTRQENNSKKPTCETATETTKNVSALAASSCSQNWKIVVGILVALIFVLLVVIALLAFLLYRKRRTGRYVYENRLYIPNKIEEFESNGSNLN